MTREISQNTDLSNHLHLAEIGALRSEVNNNIERSANKENFCGGACAALIAFGFSRKQFDALSASAIVLSILIWAFGFARYRVMSEHTKVIDRYLEIIESKFCSDGGWATWYRENEPKSFPNYAMTRSAFWGVLAAVIMISLIFLSLKLT